MNILKERDEPKILKHLRLLNQRLDLTIDQKQYLYNLEKGFEGEQHCDEEVGEHVSGECLIINDLLLVINGTTIQIDSLMITAEEVKLFEIKNYKGDYTMQSDALLL